MDPKLKKLKAEIDLRFSAVPNQMDPKLTAAVAAVNAVLVQCQIKWIQNFSIKGVPVAFVLVQCQIKWIQNI